jgi:hypothetical protein
MLGLLQRFAAKNAGASPATPDAAPSGAGTPDALAQIYGTDYPAPSAPAKTKWEYVQELIRQGDVDALARYREGTRNLLYYNNRQWIDWIPGRRCYEDLPNAENELRVVMNYIAPILRARTSRLLPKNVGWYGIPDSNSFESRDRMNVAVNLVKARYRALDMDHKLRSALPLADCTGMAVLKSFWNPNTGEPTPATKLFPVLAMGPDGQPSIDPMTGQPKAEWHEVPVDASGMPVENPDDAYKYRPGDTDTCVRTIFNLRTNPDAQGWTPAEGLRWLIDTDVVPMTTAKAKFSEIATQISPLAENESFLVFERMVQGSVAQKSPAIITAAAGASKGLQNKDLCAIREYWELPCDAFPEGRLIVLVGGAQAYDGPYPQGIFPYAPFFSGVAPLSPWGRKMVNDLISPQDVINREWSSIVREMGNTSNGQFVTFDIPGMADSITTRERSIIKVPYSSFSMNRGIGDVFKRLDPAQVPSDRWRMIEQSKITMFDIGAFHEITRGQIPPGLDSGVAVQQLMESEAGQLTEPVEALRRCLKLWAKHQLHLAKWGYHDHEERALPVDRPDLGILIETVTGDSLPDPERMQIDIEAFKPQSEAALRADVKDLMVNQIIDPRDGLRAMDMGRGIDGLYDSQTRDYARARRENLDLEKGLFLEMPRGVAPGPDGVTLQPLPPMLLHVDLSPFLLEQDDDHEIHVRVHYELLKDDSIPWDVRQVVLAHVEEHRQAHIMSQMRDAMMTGQLQQHAGAGDGESSPPSKGKKQGQPPQRKKQNA